MARVEAVVADGLRHPNAIQTYQTRRAVLTKEWLDDSMLRTAPLLDSMSSFSTSLFPSSSKIEVGVDESIISSLMDAYESKDGFGTPVRDPPPHRCLSLKEILVKSKAVEGCVMTVILMELASEGNLDQAIKMQLFDLNRTVRASSTPDSVPSPLSPAVAADTKPTATRKSRQVYRAVLRTVKEIAQGLAVIHEMEIVHCDLKPSNILLRAVHSDWRGFNASICDFGLSRLAPMSLTESEEKQKACGTLVYLSPERLQGSACKSSDVYSLGIILFQLISNSEPFKDVPSDIIIAGVKAGKLQPKWPQGVFPELKHVYEQCVLFDPLARPSASEVVRELTLIELQLRIGMVAADPSMVGEDKLKAAALAAAMKQHQAARAVSARSSVPTSQTFQASTSTTGALTRQGSAPGPVLAAMLDKTSDVSF